MTIQPPAGRALVTVDEIPGQHELSLTTTVNSEVMQTASTAQMLHSVKRLIAIVSSSVTLIGDIIATGTPAGVGAARRPPQDIKDGDTVTVPISRLGELTNPGRSRL